MVTWNAEHANKKSHAKYKIILLIVLEENENETLLK